MDKRRTFGAAARAQRLSRLQDFVESDGPVPLKQAAQRLDVTEMTVRRDLASAAPTQGALAVLGGYVVATAPAAPDRYSLDEASDQHAANKRLACQHAATCVQPHDCLFIDCGTTMVHFAEALPADMPLSVVCYSSNIASVVARRPRTQLMMLGGLYHPSSATFYSDEGLQYLIGLGLNKAFISAGGVDPERGASCSFFHEVAVKQAAIRCATESHLLIDQSKLGKLRPAFFSPLDAFSQIVVGGTAVPAGLRKKLKGFPLKFVEAAAS